MGFPSGFNPGTSGWSHRLLRLDLRLQVTLKDFSRHDVWHYYNFASLGEEGAAEHTVELSPALREWLQAKDGSAARCSAMGQNLLCFCTRSAVGVCITMLLAVVDCNDAGEYCTVTMVILKGR